LKESIKGWKIDNLRSVFLPIITDNNNKFIWKHK